MDKIGTPHPDYLSRQVVGARYFFHSLSRRRRAEMAVALGGRETCRPDYALHRLRFPFVGLEYVAEGSGRVVLNGQRHGLEPGTLFTYARATRCEIQTDPAHPMVKYFLCLAGPSALAVLGHGGLPPPAVKVLRMHSEVRSVFEDLIREGQHHGRFAPEIAVTLLQLLLLKAKAAGVRGPRATAGEAGREAILRCKALIDAEAARLGTLSEIAAAAGHDASSVCRLFRRYQGTSPYQYLLRRKMALAASHLVEHRGLVKEAALRIGFSDPYLFSRRFKSIYGISPSDLAGGARCP